MSRNRPRRAEKLFDPAVEEGSIAAYELRAFLGRLARHLLVRFARLDMGTPVDPSAILEGRLEVPSLGEMRANRTGGIVLEEEGDELSRGARVADLAATGTRKPICLEGDFGYWDRCDGCFQPMSSFSEYLRVGIANLFAGEWQGAAFDSEASEGADRARALLGTPAIR